MTSSEHHSQKSNIALCDKFLIHDFSTACKKGRFGADCSLTCNCVDELCDPVTGVCENGCDRGYTGDTCQIPLFFNT